MKVVTSEIFWHDKGPVYSLDFQHGLCRTKEPGNGRLATGGVDAAVRVWFVSWASDGGTTVELLSNLTRHTATVNSVRFSPDGETLASGGDDSLVLLWKREETDSTDFFFLFVLFILPPSLVSSFFSPIRGHVGDVYDLAWSPCGKLLLSGSIDNTAVLWDSRPRKLFHDESLSSFFRRLSFSTKGDLLFAPAGCVEDGETITHTTYVFSRSNLRRPIAHFPTRSKPTIAVRCCPVLFTLQRTNMMGLPYRVIFAVAAEDAIMIYDSQHEAPFAFVGNIHYHTLSDITWSADGLCLAVSSTDGFCSFISFAPGELGTPLPTEASSNLQTSLLASSPHSSTPQVPNLQLQKDNEKESERKQKVKHSSLTF
uniref:Chromatin assembly factor 1, subunit B n=1 Tax=Eptatretus burgeri TaxID=7764 RepID=A0A8C4WU51_EPTBU